MSGTGATRSGARWTRRATCRTARWSARWRSRQQSRRHRHRPSGRPRRPRRSAPRRPIVKPTGAVISWSGSITRSSRRRSEQGLYWFARGRGAHACCRGRPMSSSPMCSREHIGPRAPAQRTGWPGELRTATQSVSAHAISSALQTSTPVGSARSPAVCSFAPASQMTCCSLSRRASGSS